MTAPLQENKPPTACDADNTEELAKQPFTQNIESVDVLRSVKLTSQKQLPNKQEEDQCFLLGYN